METNNLDVFARSVTTKQSPKVRLLLPIKIGIAETRSALKRPYTWVIIFLLALNILPILAPIFLYLGWDILAKPIYFIYSFTCHQFAHRSLHIHDHQCAWCSRDMAIWGSLLVVAILVRKFKLTRGIPFYWVIPFTIPIALDGGIQTIATVLSINPNIATGDPLYISTNFMRIITGMIFGTGLGLWLLPNLYSGMESDGQLSLLENVRIRKALGYTFAISLSSFLLFIGMWQVTSPNFPPANILDLQVRTPVNKDFYLRREHGSCPTNALNDPLAIKCFFGS